MRKALQWGIVISIILVTFVLPVWLYVVSSANNKINTSKDNGVQLAVTIDVSPIRFESIPPSIAIPNGVFMYQLLVEDITGSDLVIEVKEKPSWLEWDSEKNILRGDIPSDQSTFYISILAKNSWGEEEYQNFTVSIDEEGVTSTEQDVKGIKDSAWIDPFHPDQAITESASLYLSASPPGDVLGVSTTRDNLQEDNTNSYIIGSGIVIFIIGTVYYLYSTNEKNKFVKGTGKLIIERGKG